MRPNFRKMKRRPFWVPLLMPLALLALVIGAAIWLLDARTSTVLVVVRHAELEQRELANPPLSAEGLQRAIRLQQQLAQAKPERGVDAVYVSEVPAAQQTATPLAESMGLAVNVVSAADWTNLPGVVMRNHAGEVVVIVADRAAMTSLLKQVTTADFVVDETDYGSVFVISRSRLSKPTAIRLRY
jgi:phosphohistidine phosphatase SixA